MKVATERDLLKEMAGTKNGVFTKRPLSPMTHPYDTAAAAQAVSHEPPPLAPFSDAELVEELRLRGALLMTHYTDKIPVELFSSYMGDEDFIRHRRLNAHSALGAELEKTGVDTLERRVDHIPNYLLKSRERFYERGNIEHQTTLVSLRVRRGSKS